MIDELKTTIETTAETKELTNLASNIDSVIMSEVIELLNDTAEKIENDIVEEVTSTVAERLGSYQEQFISMNGTVDTGYMRDTILVESSGEEGTVAPTALSITGFPYPLVIEEGSKPHVIEGNPYLYWEGADHPVRKVNHPGTDAKPFVEPSVENIQKDIPEIVDEAVSKILS